MEETALKIRKYTSVTLSNLRNFQEDHYGIKLKSTTADTVALKLLRKHFPNLSLAELRAKIQTHNYLYLSDMEKYHEDGNRKLLKLLREFDETNLETELFEEHRDTPAPWQAKPMSREFFYNTMQRSREIKREVLLDVEREVTGFVSPEALAAIEQEFLEDASWKLDE